MILIVFVLCCSLKPVASMARAEGEDAVRNEVEHVRAREVKCRPHGDEPPLFNDTVKVALLTDSALVLELVWAASRTNVPPRTIVGPV